MRSLLSRVYSNHEEHILNVVAQLMNLLAFVSCCSLIFLYLKFKSIRSLATTVLFWISIAGLIQSLAVFLSINGTLHEGILCRMQAFVLQLSSIASLLYSTLITIIIYKVLLNAKNSSFVLFDNVNNWWLKTQIVVWSLSMLSAFIPLFFPNAYGPSGGICWIIQKDALHQWLRYLLFYIPWFLCVILMIILSYKVTKYALYDQDFNANTNNNIDRVLKTMWYYPLLILLIYFFYAVRRTNELITGEAAIFMLAVLSYIGYFRQTINFIIFCFTPNVKKSLRNMLNLDKSTATEEHVDDAQQNTVDKQIETTTITM